MLGKGYLALFQLLLKTQNAVGSRSHGNSISRDSRATGGSQWRWTLFFPKLLRFFFSNLTKMSSNAKVWNPWGCARHGKKCDMFISHHGTCRFWGVNMDMDHHRLVHVILVCPPASHCFGCQRELGGLAALSGGQTEVAIEDFTEWSLQWRPPSALHFTRAIALRQDLPVAYNNRGIAHEVL